MPGLALPPSVIRCLTILPTSRLPTVIRISIPRVRRRSTRSEDNWRGALDYSWTPVYKAWEPFKKMKNKSKWLDILKRFGLNWLPQNIAFNTEMTRDTYELQERDMEQSGAAEDSQAAAHLQRAVPLEP